MTQLLAIDVGGTTIKYAYWDGTKLSDFGYKPTPHSLVDFYATLEQIKDQFATQKIEGVAMSIPGAVNKATGMIEGTSALPYIHNFHIEQELTARLGVPVSLENDANCAALAELEAGIAKGKSSVALFVIGTGIGGSLILDGKVWHGAHLHGGEFGFMLTKYDDTLSHMASPVNMARRYNQRTGKQCTGKEVFELAKQGDSIAVAERDILIETLTTAIYNIQHSFDPEMILIGGGISANEELIPMLYQQWEKIKMQVGMPIIKPEIKACTLKNHANLRGAVVDFEQNCI